MVRSPAVCYGSDMSRALVLVVLPLSLALGCGGSTTKEPVREPDPTPSSSKPEPEPEGEPAAPTEKPAASGGESSESPTVALEGKDLEAVLNLLFADPGLLNHLHLAEKGRGPLKISGDKLPAKLEVVAGSYEVKVVPDPGNNKKSAVLVLTKLERTGDEAKVHYRFDIEGVEGRASFRLSDGKWELRANRLIEK